MFHGKFLSTHISWIKRGSAMTGPASAYSTRPAHKKKGTFCFFDIFAGTAKTRYGHSPAIQSSARLRPASCHSRRKYGTTGFAIVQVAMSRYGQGVWWHVATGYRGLRRWAVAVG